MVTFWSEHPLEKIEVVPLTLVCTALGILCFVGLLFWVCEASEEG